MPNGSDRITGHPVQELKPDKEVDDPEIKAWLALGTKSKKKGGGAKKKGGPTTAFKSLLQMGLQSTVWTFTSEVFGVIGWWVERVDGMCPKLSLCRSATKGSL